MVKWHIIKYGSGVNRSGWVERTARTGNRLVSWATISQDRKQSKDTLTRVNEGVSLFVFKSLDAVPVTLAAQFISYRTAGRLPHVALDY